MKTLNRLFTRPWGWAFLAGALAGGIAIGALSDVRIGPKAYAQSQTKMNPAINLSGDSLATLRALDNAFASIAEFVSPSVVSIRSESATSRTPDGRMIGPSGGEGSGVIYRPDGWILTNDHVVGGFDKVTVALSDGRTFPGKVYRTGEKTDLAVVKIEAKDLPAAHFGDSKAVKVGQFALAMGAPFGLENTLTVGHISALGRLSAITDPRTGLDRLYSDMIQTDASINMGNSGGPLMNVEGEVIGLNSAIYSGTGGNVGIGFAIPSNQARLVADMLIEKGKIERGYLMLEPSDLKPFQKSEMKLDSGALVANVIAGGPAEKAGIKEGDVITRIGDRNVQTQQDLRDSMLFYGPGKTVPIDLIRSGKKMTLNVKIGSAPAAAQLDQGQPEMFGQDGKVPDIRGFKRFFDQQQTPPQELNGKPRLGVTVGTLTDEIRKARGIKSDVNGAYVNSVEPGSLAASIGIQEGDVIVRIGSTQVKTSEDLVKAVQKVKSGQTLEIAFVRDSKNGRMNSSASVTFK